MKLFGARRPRRRYSIVTTARWEAPYVAEWLAYHRAIGFEHVYLYCNDDDPAELYTAAAGWIEGPDPFVTFAHCPYQGQQWWMFRHFLQTHAAETEWVLFIDLDEFLSLRRDVDIDAFVRRQPSDAGFILFHWTMFGHAGFKERPPGSVLTQYTRRQCGVHRDTKLLARTDRISPEILKPELMGYPMHGLEPRFQTPGTRGYDVIGQDMAGYWPDPDALFKARYFEPADAERILSEAVVHHYAIRSEADFQRRFDRGLEGAYHAQGQWAELERRGEAEGFLREISAVEDRTLADWWAAHLRARTGPLGMYPPAPAPLVSRGRPALKSSVWTPDDAPADAAAAAAGGVDSRALTGTFGFHTRAEAQPWWQVDLEAPHRIAEVRLYNRLNGSETAERADRVMLDLSDDGETWRRVYARTDRGSFGGADGRPLRWLPEQRPTARFVRVSLPGGVLHLEQVEVYGTPC